jgi:hypothetical protein
MKEADSITEAISKEHSLLNKLMKIRGGEVNLREAAEEGEAVGALVQEAQGSNYQIDGKLYYVQIGYTVRKIGTIYDHEETPENG